MILGFTGLAFLPASYPPSGYDYSTPDPFQILLDNSDADLIYLLSVTAYDPTTDAETIFYASDRGFVTEPTDSLASQPFHPVLENAYSFDVSLFQGTDPFTLASLGYGDVTLSNGEEGDYDTLSTLSLIGREIEIKAGGADFAYDDFTTVFRGTTGDVRWDEGSISLAVRSKAEVLDRSIIRSTYAGTGGKEGGTDLEGKSKPLAYGVCRQIEPVNIDWATQLWQVHDGTVYAIDAVRDKGVALTFSADYATYAALAAASIPTSRYATCLAEGLVRLKSQPAGRVTVDVRGDATGGYISSAPAIVQRLVKTQLGSLSLTDEDIDLESFASLEAARDWPVGIYLSEDAQASEVILQLIRSVGGYVTFTRDGLLSVGVLEKASSSDTAIDDDLIDSAGIECTGMASPAWRVKVGYKKVWTVLSDTDLASSVSSTDRSYFRNEYRYATASDETLLNDYKDAQDIELLTLLDEEGDAQSLADAIFSLFGSSLRRIQVPLRDLPYRYALGDTVTLETPRYGLDAGALFLIVGLSEAVKDGSTTLDLWG